MTTARLALRMSEVAEQVGVGTSTVQRWVASGRLAHIRVDGVVRIRPEQLEAFLQQHTEGDALARRRRRSA